MTVVSQLIGAPGATSINQSLISLINSRSDVDLLTRQFVWYSETVSCVTWIGLWKLCKLPAPLDYFNFKDLDSLCRTAAAKGWRQAG